MARSSWSIENEDAFVRAASRLNARHARRQRWVLGGATVLLIVIVAAVVVRAGTSQDGGTAASVPLMPDQTSISAPTGASGPTTTAALVSPLERIDPSLRGAADAPRCPAVYGDQPIVYVSNATPEGSCSAVASGATVRIWNKSSATVSLTTPQGQVTVGIDDYVDLSAADLPVPFVLDPSPLVRQTLNVVDPEDSPYGKWALDATGGGSARLGATDQEVVSSLPTPMRPAVGSELPGQITQSAEEVACPVVVDASDPYSPLLTFYPSGGSMRLAAVTLRAPGQTGPGGLSIGQAVADLLVSPGWTPDANKFMGEYPAFVYATGQGTEIIALTAEGFVIAAIVKDEGNIVSTAAVSSAFAGCGVLGGVYGP